MCGGFTCSKRSLIVLNILYVIVAITLISVAAYAKLASKVSSIPVLSGITACGVFLLMISVVGLVAASKHYQVGLFFYMIILFLIFIIQFSVACACLAMNISQQNSFAAKGWNLADDSSKHQTEVRFNCCGYIIDGNSTSECVNVRNNEGALCCPDNKVDCCDVYESDNSTSSDCKCDTCNLKLQEVIGKGLSTVGGIGLFFSFTEFLGVWLTVRYRNQRDPRANPSAFL